MILVLLFACACSPAKSPGLGKPVLLYYEGGDVTFRAAQNAADEWKLCGRTIVVSRVYAPGSIPLKEVTSIRDAVDKNAPLWVRATTGKNADGDVLFVFITQDLKEEDATILLAHEFGHVLGVVEHTKEGLMTRIPTSRPQDWVVTERECGLLK